MTKTLKDIAKKLNMSVSTISRVVNNYSYVNEETRKKVLDELNSVDYMPNQVARSLKIKSTKIIGIVVPDICERFFGQIIKGVDAVISDTGYSIILVDTNENKVKEEMYLDLLFQQRVDALIIATVDIHGTKVLQYFKHNIPVVFIDNLPDIKIPYDAILIDNVQASKLAIERFIRAGDTKIAIITGIPNETTGYERLQGYKQALSVANIDIDERLIMHGNYKEESGYRCMEELIRNRNEVPFSAVYVASELMTYGAIKAIRANGLEFPADIKLIGFDLHDKSELISPGITTVRQPEQLIGKLTAELLLKKLENNQSLKPGMKTSSDSGQKTLLTPYLDVKQSG